MKNCRLCVVALTDDNWYASRQRRRDYICKSCQNTANLPATTEWNKRRRERLRAQGRALLGGVCQLCSASTGLQFAHLRYVDGECRSGVGVALEVIETPERFLLLCGECHKHPERYFVELIALRAAVASVVTADPGVATGGGEGMADLLSGTDERKDLRRVTF